MKYFFTSVLIACSLLVHAQALRDINYNYQYNPDEPVKFYLKAVRLSSGWNIFYKMITKDTAADMTLTWESRESINQKDGNALEDLTTREFSHNKNGVSGIIEFTKEQAPKVLIAKVVDNKSKSIWQFYKELTETYPVTNYVIYQGEPLFFPYYNSDQSLRLAGNGNWIVSYYNDDFPAASPAFAETQGKVSKGMVSDSTFLLSSNQDFPAKKNGLYLIQQDTTSTEGFAFRVEDDYPKFGKISSLAGPFIYISAKQEYDKLVASKSDKKSFDKVILSIAKDAERAKNLMRIYFRRVELANQYFTSYKEGWKTDRGMIYIVFGLPDEVLKYSDREVWSYRNDQYRVTFNFVKSSSVYDAENYVLLRDKRYQQTWYEVVDLIRNGRF